MPITDPELIEYAGQLEEAGFAIYEPHGRSFDYFAYSRVVDGQECVGFVQRESLRAFGGFTHSMPIKPSREHGSSMWVAGVEDNDLSVQAAEKVASPTNHNHLVGTQRNYSDPEWMAQGYTKRDRSNA